jgi:hypothetical protein
MQMASPFAQASLTALLPHETNMLLWSTLLLFLKLSPHIAPVHRNSHLNLVRAGIVCFRWVFMQSVRSWKDGQRPIRYDLCVDKDCYKAWYESPKKHPLWEWEPWFQQMDIPITDEVHVALYDQLTREYEALLGQSEVLPTMTALLDQNGLEQLVEFQQRCTERRKLQDILLTMILDLGPEDDEEENKENLAPCAEVTTEESVQVPTLLCDESIAPYEHDEDYLDHMLATLEDDLLVSPMRITCNS